MDFEVFNFSEKITCFVFILCYEFNSVHVNPLILKGDSRTYFLINIISTVFVLIFAEVVVIV
jgi:hypothetical protein